MTDVNPTVPKGKWEPSNWYLAQVVHVLAGAYVFYSGLTGLGLDVWKFYFVYLLITGLKEFALDVAPWFEGDSLKGSAWDFGCYQLGAFGGILGTYFYWPGNVVVIGVILSLFTADYVIQASRRRGYTAHRMSARTIADRESFRELLLDKNQKLQDSIAWRRFMDQEERNITLASSAFWSSTSSTTNAALDDLLSRYNSLP